MHEGRGTLRPKDLTAPAMGCPNVAREARPCCSTRGSVERERRRRGARETRPGGQRGHPLSVRAASMPGDGCPNVERETRPCRSTRVSVARERCGMAPDRRVHAGRRVHPLSVRATCMLADGYQKVVRETRPCCSTRASVDRERCRHGARETRPSRRRVHPLIVRDAGMPADGCPNVARETRPCCWTRASVDRERCRHGARETRPYRRRVHPLRVRDTCMSADGCPNVERETRPCRRRVHPWSVRDACVPADGCTNVARETRPC